MGLSNLQEYMAMLAVAKAQSRSKYFLIDQSFLKISDSKNMTNILNSKCAVYIMCCLLDL
jgi:hypothetical protein